MGLPKGRTNNPKGRPRKPNRFTVELRTWIQSLIDSNRAQLETDLKSMEPIQRWQIIERLMNYTTPKMQNIEAHLEYDQLTEEHLNRIATDLLNNIQNDTINKRNKNQTLKGY